MKKLKEVEKEKLVPDLEHLPSAYKNFIKGKVYLYFASKIIIKCNEKINFFFIRYLVLWNLLLMKQYTKI